MYPTQLESVDSAGRTEVRMLVHRMAGGDHAAVAGLYDRTSRLVYTVALRMLSRPEDAEEVTCDVYLQAWRTARAYDPSRGTVEAWLLTMARTRAIDRLRARKARREALAMPLDDLAHPSLDAPPDHLLASRTAAERARRLLRGLPVPERDLIELAFFGGQSHRELSTRLGIPLGTVKTRIRSGLLRLRRGLTATACEA